MKKNNFFAQAALLTAVFPALAGCLSSDKGVYDPSVPPEQLCVLEIYNALEVYEFDGNAVEWTSPLFANRIVIQIPASRHVFAMDFAANDGRYYLTAQGLIFSYTFEPGKSYTMGAFKDVGNTIRIQVDIKE
jgi:hypothetical protein